MALSDGQSYYSAVKPTFELLDLHKNIAPVANTEA